MGPLYVVIALVVVLILFVWSSYNRFVQQRQLVKNSYANIDTELQRRHDLIPNLVETVKGYAAHESQVLEEVTQARANAISAQGTTPGQQAQQENVLSGALKSLFAVSEKYPDLKAAANFLELQKELTDTEDRIQAARRFYNNNVRAFNTRVQTVPSNIVAGLFNMKVAEYFSAGEGDDATPDVNLN